MIPPIGTQARADWAARRLREAWELAGRPTTLTRDGFRRVVAGSEERWPSSGDLEALGGWQAAMRKAMRQTPMDLDYDGVPETISEAPSARDDMGRLLIIPDAHSHPDHDNRRFVELAKLIRKERPEHLLILGDWWDFESLSGHASQIEKEGHRVQEDWDHGMEALDIVSESMAYGPTSANFLVGNHEARLDRMKAANPEWDGATRDLGQLRREIGERGWVTHNFKQIVEVCGYAASHFLPSGLKGDPVSGVQIARSLIQKGNDSAIVGHAHTLGIHTQTSYLGRPIQAICAGCFAHQDMVAGWNLNTSQMWWRGVVMVDLIAPGYGDLNCISAETMGV